MKGTAVYTNHSKRQINCTILIIFSIEYKSFRTIFTSNFQDPYKNVYERSFPLRLEYFHLATAPTAWLIRHLAKNKCWPTKLPGFLQRHFLQPQKEISCISTIKRKDCIYEDIHQSGLISFNNWIISAVLQLNEDDECLLASLLVGCDVLVSRNTWSFLDDLSAVSNLIYTHVYVLSENIILQGLG